MVARTTVSQPGFEFPTGTASSACLAQILPYFRDNYYLDEDFEVSAVSAAGIFSLVFTSRQPGTPYNFETRVIPGIKVQVKTAGIERKVKPNFSIYVEAWIEKAEGSAFEKVFSESLQTDQSGRTEWDLSDLLHPELLPDIHRLEGRQFNKDINSKRRYYIRYAEAWGTSYQIGKITKGPLKHVTLGGTLYESGATVTIMDLVRESSEAADDRALRLGPDVRYVYPDEP
ncbi:hypothetical protein [Dyadobacter bucti]|uniref:hypothetical protein n=1 Tax=Dyadobacter bucti TaxID=2572203 RepID=UPI003F7282D2